MAVAFLQQSAEHLFVPWPERRLFLVRILLVFLLILGIQPLIVESLLLVVSLVILHRFQGPYNGGSDRMSLLMLVCVWLARLAPTERWQEIALGYLAAQVVLSYAISGGVKVFNPDWRNGRALRDLLEFSNYPVSENLRTWSSSSRLLTILSWALLSFEILFPLALVNATILKMALLIAATFHLANACLFGLNRFLWIWLASYPSLLWFQQRAAQSFGP